MQDIKQLVTARAEVEPAFRAALLADPRAALESWFGTALPPQVEVRVVEEAPDAYVVVLPHAATAAADGELADADLEAVAGGSKAGAKKFFNDLSSKVLLEPVKGLSGGTISKKQLC